MAARRGSSCGGGASLAGALIGLCLLAVGAAAQQKYSCNSKSIEWSGQLGAKKKLGTVKVCWDKVRPPNASVVLVDASVKAVANYAGFGVRGRSSTTETTPSTNATDFYPLDRPNSIKDYVKTYSFFQKLSFPGGLDPQLLAAFTAGCNPLDAGMFQRTLLVSGIMTKKNGSDELVEESTGFKRRGKC